MHAESCSNSIITLDSARSTLLRLKECIICALIERVQFYKNHVIYDASYLGLTDPTGAPTSLLDWMFIETERTHVKVRRYTSHDEHAFYPQFLVDPLLPELDFGNMLMGSTEAVNLKNEIKEWYINKILDRLCVDGYDNQHGISVICDISAMQAISKRIHIGKFIAEAKFTADPENTVVW
jgi:chorismate mutase